jgi:hypothetical protein
VLLAGAPAARAALVEGILEVHAEAAVHDDGSVTVDETILVYADRVRITRGIALELPARARDADGGAAFDLDIASVTRDGQPEPFEVDVRRGRKRLRIGSDRVVLARGTHVYVVSYRTQRQIEFRADRDRLVWNVTGDAGDFPIEQASAVVRLPAGAARDLGDLVGFTGPPASPRRDVVADRRGPAAVFTARRPLAPHESLVVIASWPKGYVHAPGLLLQGLYFVRDQGLVLAALAALLLQIVCLRAARGGATPAARAPAPASAPPAGLTPAALRFVVERRADGLALAAALLDAEARGGAAIARGADGVEVVTRAGAGELPPEERAALDALLAGGDAARLEPASGAAAAARRALAEALAAGPGERYFFRRAHYLLPGLGLGLLAALLLAASAPGAGARAAAAGLGLALLPWTGGAALLAAGCLRLWSLARPRGRGAVARAAAWSSLALVLAAGALAGLAAFGYLTSPAGAVLLAATLAASHLLVRLPRAPTAAGRAVIDGARAYRAFLAAGDAQAAGEHAPYALALGVAPAASDAAAFASAVQASVAPGGR